jgi:hypothetical protein
MTFSFLPGTALDLLVRHCSSSNSVMQLIHILHFSTTSNLLQIHRRKSPDESNLGPLPIQQSGNSLSRMAQTWQEVRWCTIQVETCSQRDMMQSSVLHHSQKVSPVTTGFSKKEGPITLPLIKAHHTMTYRESWSCSVTPWGLSLPHTWQLCLLNVPHMWEAALSEKCSVLRYALFNVRKHS